MISIVIKIFNIKTWFFGGSCKIQNIVNNCIVKNFSFAISIRNPGVLIVSIFSPMLMRDNEVFHGVHVFDCTDKVGLLNAPFLPDATYESRLPSWEFLFSGLSYCSGAR